MLVYTVDVGKILDETSASEDVSGPVTLPSIDVQGELFRPARAATVSVSLINSNDGIIATGTVDAVFAVECARCLCPFEMPVTGALETYFVVPDRASTVPSEQEYGLIEHGEVDLGPAIMAAVTVELPIAPLHDPECAGICPMCGVDRNVSPCSCEPSEDASPFAGLRTLLDAHDAPEQD
jgi:uncharacterized protein